MPFSRPLRAAIVVAPLLLVISSLAFLAFLAAVAAAAPPAVLGIEPPPPPLPPSPPSRRLALQAEPEDTAPVQQPGDGVQQPGDAVQQVQRSLLAQREAITMEYALQNQYLLVEDIRDQLNLASAVRPAVLLMPLLSCLLPRLSRRPLSSLGLSACLPAGHLPLFC